LIGNKRLTSHILGQGSDILEENSDKSGIKTQKNLSLRNLDREEHGEDRWA